MDDSNLWRIKNRAKVEKREMTKKTIKKGTDKIQVTLVFRRSMCVTKVPIGTHVK